jgi:hypothetical protein
MALSSLIPDREGFPPRLFPGRESPVVDISAGLF